MKKIQITQDLFVKILKYFYSEEFELVDDELFELYRDIKKGIDQKLDAISKRSYYTEYKTADTDEAKEQARQKYLDAVGMIRISDIDFTLIVQTGMWHIPVKIIKNERIE